MLIMIGATFIFSDDLGKLTSLLHSSTWVGIVRKSLSRLQFKRKLSLKQKLHQMRSGNHRNFIIKAYLTMTHIMADTGSGDKIRLMNTIAFISGVAGVFVAIYAGSVMLIPILGIGCALLPMWLIKFKAYRHNVLIMNELSVVLSMVSNSYMRCENVVRAVEENLEYINDPVKAHFQWFITVSKQVSADISGNLEGLKQRLDNPVFRLWCDNLIMCQQDINQKHSLNAVVEQFAVERELINMLSTEISKPVKIYSMVAGLTMLALPMGSLIAREFSPDGAAVNVLLTTLPGQCIVVGYAVTLLFGINRAIELSTKM